MQRIGLAETIEAIRGELTTAIASAAGSKLHFPVEGIQLEFSVIVEKETDGRAGIHFWVVDVGGSAGYRNEQTQKVSVTLGTPMDDDGRPIKIMRGSDLKP